MKKFTLLFAAILAVSMSFATTVTKTVESLATELSWTNTTVCTPFALDNAITVSTTATDANTGKYYSNGQQIRLYQTGSATITLTAGEGYSISSVALTYVSQNTGILLDATGATYESGTDFAVNAQAVTFSVGNSGEATNGQARVTGFSVTYTGAGADTTSQDTTPVVPPVQMETLLFNANIWNVTDVNEKYAAWIWGDSLEGQWTDFFTPLNAQNMYAVQIPVTADSIVFVRLNNTIDTVKWTNIWNQTIDYAINYADLYFTVVDWGEGENAKCHGTWGTPVVITSLADAKLLAAGTEITTTGIVTYINGKNAYMQDATDGILLYGTSNFTNFQVGDEIVIDAKVASYGNAPELSNVVLRNIVSSENTVNPILMTLAERVANPLQNFGMLVTINELTITAYDNYRNPTFSDGTNTIVGYKFSMDTTAFPIGSVVDVTAIAAFYNNIQIQGNTAGVVMHEYEQVHYYIKNNWDGASDWTWVAMNPVMNNVIYEYTGVFGGTGVNINTAASDEGSTWFSVENFSVLDSTFVPQASDTLHFVYSIVDSVLAVELVGRPAADTLHHYYIKNNWNGAADWSWVEMNMVMDNVLYEYTGVFGGSGVNINTAASDAGSTWFSVENFSVLDSTFVPQALDTLHFVYSIVDSVLAVELVGRPAPAPEVFQIKNNWNGGEWTWVDMTPVEGQENIYEYTGVFGGTGVNITSNYMNGELWFPVDSFLVNEGDLVPQAMDTVLFAYNSVENEVGAMVLGRPEPVVLDTIVAGVHIINETGWAQLNLYMWGQAGELFGGWPGQTLNEDYAVEGVEGSYFAIIGPYAGLEENLIFNDGNGVQFRDLTISLVDTVYEIVVRADGAYFADQVPAEALTIAEATATELGTELITRGIVTYINNKNAYIQDATAGILLYGTAAFADQFSVGDEIIVSAKRAEYGGAPELSYVTLDTILSFGNTVTPIRMTLAERAAEPFKNFGMMVTVKDLTISAFDNYNNPTLTDGENSAVCYKMNVDTTVFHIGDIVDITAIAGYFNAIQFQGDVAGITMHVDDMYYIKNNWNRGADWTWMDMIPADDGNLTWMYTGIFGGTGVNINTAATDVNALWFPIDAMIIPEGNEAPEAGDSVMFVYNTVDKTVTATVLSQVIPGEDITVTFFVRDENTIWEDLYVYAWGAAEAFGAWNGYQVNQEENIIVGGEYDYRFTLTGDYEGLTLNLIFNDGIGGGEGHQFADLAIEDMQDGDEYFIIVTDEKAYFEGGEGLEEVVSNAKNETTKVIMNGQLYIIRDGKVYNALGAQVR